jgi:hypothetical protein
VHRVEWITGATSEAWLAGILSSLPANGASRLWLLRCLDCERSYDQS